MRNSPTIVGVLGLAVLFLSACGDDEPPEVDLTTRVCSTTCNKAATCGELVGAEVDPSCQTDCDGLVRPLLEVDAGAACASDAEINACIEAVNNVSCIALALLPNPVPEACELCGIDFDELFMMEEDGGVDAGMDAGEGDAGVEDAGESDAGGDAGPPQA